MSNGLRKASFAGSWYPAGADACEKEIAGFLDDRSLPGPAANAFVGGIVPHAGWYFSGKIACNVIAALREEIPVDVILLFGMHLHAGSPAVMMTEGAFETPFGPLEVHSAVAQKLAADFSFQIETAQRHTPDNTIELQLPFIRYFFPEVQVVAMGVPPVTESLSIGRAAVRYIREMGQNPKVIGSTDLTHYGMNYGFMGHGSGSQAVEWVREKNDRPVIEAMLQMAPEMVIEQSLTHHNACCGGAAATAIAACKELGAVRGRQLAYATSYDKHPGDSFVGYVGLVFET
jgi:AmmeMemoRadiSam system protein B